MLFEIQNPHGGDVYGGDVRMDYSANTNPFGTPEAVLDAIRDCLQNLHQYPDPYCRKLVKAIAEFEQVPEDTILCGNGAAELIYSFAEALHPRSAVVLAPTFSEYRLSLEKTDCRVQGYRLRQKDGFSVRQDFLGFLQQEKPQLVCLCNPNNPTGKTIDFPLLQEILDFCHRNRIRLLADECFLDLTEGGRSLKEFITEYPELFILKAFTKSYGMAGIRLGYCLSGDRELLRSMAQKSQPWNVSTPAQAAGVAALQQREFLRKTLDLVRQERKYLTEKLRELGFWVSDSQTNFILFHGPAGLDQELKKHGIAIRNCDNYEGLGPGWYRIAVRLHSQNMVLTETMARILERNS